jgi:hypothetical protein
MKKFTTLAIVITFCAMIFTSTVSAYTVSAWNGPYTITSIRQNGNGFWFQVVPKISNETDKWFGCVNTLTNYNTLVSIVLAAKTSGRTVNFYIDKDPLSGTATGSGTVASITGVDIN